MYAGQKSVVAAATVDFVDAHWGYESLWRACLIIARRKNNQINPNLNKDERMRNAWKALVIVAINLLVLSGCASVHKMALEDGTQTLELENEGLLLMTLDLENQYKPDYQPELLVVYTRTRDEQGEWQYHNFTTDKKAAYDLNPGSRYFVSLKLPAGAYRIDGMACIYRGLLLMGHCMLPLYADVNVEAGRVHYLGRVSGTLVEYKEGDIRAGAILPLVDQAVTGFAHSTFNVSITDAFDEDRIAYASRFPVLQNNAIEKQVLPPYDLERVKQVAENPNQKEE